MNAVTKPDLLTPTETPRTDAVVSEHGPDAIMAIWEHAKRLERELGVLRDVADEMGRALRRGPFEADYTFGERRQMAYEKYAQLVKETLK